MNTYTPVRIDHQLPAPTIEIVPAPVVAEIAAALAAAAAITAVDSPEQLQTADAAAVEIHRLAKVAEEHRKAAKAPILELGKAIDDACKPGLAKLDEAKKSLQRLSISYQNKVRAEAERIRREQEEAERKAREEAEAERRRLQAEADAAAKEAADLLGVEVEPEVVAMPELPMPRVVIDPRMPPNTYSAVKTRKVQRVEINDPRALAHAYEVAGAVLVQPDAKVVERLLKAGVSVPGAKLVTEEIPVMGRR